MKTFDLKQRLLQVLKLVPAALLMVLSISGLFAQTRLNQSIIQRNGNAQNFLLTPDGSKIVYLADFDNDEVFELYSAPTRGIAEIAKLNESLGVGGNVRRLGSISTPFEISPDGTRVVYTANKPGGAYELYSVSINGGAITKLNGDLGVSGNVFSFKITPDGTKVIFETGSSRNPEEIWSVSIFGGAPINLSNTPNSLERVIPPFVGEPSFKVSPDGTNVVFRAGAIRSPENLYIVPVAGGTPLALSSTPLPARRFPAYQVSQDGSRIIYAEQDGSFGQINLFSVEPNGTNRVNLNGTLPADRTASSFFLINSTSTHVVYIADKDTDNQFELFSVPLAGGSSIKLNGTMIAEGDVGGSNDDRVMISPDGDRVLYRADAETDELQELYSVPILGGTAVKLNGTINGGNIRRYLITPNSDTVVYMADQAQAFQIELFSVPITGGTPKRVHPFLSNSGDISFFTLSDTQPGRIVYTALRSSVEPTNLFSVRLDGTETLQLTDAVTGRVFGQDFQVIGGEVFFRSNLLLQSNLELFKISVASPPFRWDGDDSNEWENRDNWINDKVPDITSNVIIKDVGNSPVIRQFDYAVRSLHLEGDAEVIVNSDAGLFIDKTFSREGQGAVVINRKITGNYGLTMIGSPVTAGRVGDLGVDLAFSYDESTNSFVDATTRILAGGEGIMVARNGVAPTVGFRGVPNTTAITYALSVTGDNENGVQDGYNLIANPYATSIDRSAFITENVSKIDGNIWIWNDGNQNAGNKRGGDYMVVNNMGAVSAVADSDGISGLLDVYDEENDVISSSQGFFVLASTDGALLTFRPSMQRLNPQLGSRSENNVSTGGDRLKLSLSPADIGNAPYNEIIIGLEEEATYGKDYGWDAGKFSGNDALSFYSLQSGDQYAIQALPKPADEPLMVDLGFYVAEKGTYELGIKEIENPEGLLTINLIDHYTGNVINLKDSAMLKFTVASSGTYDDRFSVEFRSARVTITDELSAENLKIINGTTKSLSLTYPASNAHVSIYNLRGSMVYEQEVILHDNKAEVKTQLNENEVYILRVNEETIKFKIR